MKIGKNAKVIAMLTLTVATVGIVGAAAWNATPVGEGKTVHVMMTPI